MRFEEKFDQRMPDGAVPLEEIQDALGAGFRVSSAQRIAGGFSHLNYRVEVEGSPAAFVLRVSDKPRAAVETELEVLGRVRGSVPVPEVVHVSFDQDGRHFVLFELVAGRPLHEVEAALSVEDRAAIGADLGRVLAAIHDYRFEAPGLLGPGWTVAQPFASFAGAIAHHTLACFQEAARRDRLTSEEAERACGFVKAHMDVLEAIRPVARLTHADFNQKNLMVAPRGGAWGVSAVLDWEFAFSGAPVMDLANFFRFEDETPPGYRRPLLEAYRAHGGHLEEGWRAQARLVDLINMAQFLAKEGDSPRTFATARSVLFKTMTGGLSA